MVKNTRERGVTVSKYARLPEKIEHVNFVKHVSAMKQRVLLEYLGVKYASSKSGCAAILQTYLAQADDRSRAKIQRGYDLIVRNVVPEGTTEAGVAVNLEQISERFYHLLGTLKEDELRSQVGALAEKMQRELLAYGKQELARAAQDYRPLVIKQVGKKNRVVTGVLPDEFIKMVQLGSARVNILLVGPSGCGKTYLAAKLAEALGLTRYGDQSMAEGVSEAEFIGRLLPIGKGGAFEHVTTPFLECYEKGGLFLFDEMDNSDPNLLVFLNKALANDYIYIPSRHENPLVKKHPDFVAVGAMNTYGHGADMMYVGRNQLDAATLDRFRTGLISMDYSVKVETALVSKPVYEWGIKIRKAIKKHGLQRIMSTRTLLDVEKMAVQADWTMTDWNGAYFADWQDDERGLVMAEFVPDLSGAARVDEGNVTARRSYS